MTNTDPSQVQVGNIPWPWPPGHEPLWYQVEQWAHHGLSLELIVALVMSNPNGTGAMDVASQSVSGITKQYQELCGVQSDIITIDSILSKIESELGNNPNPNPNDPGLKKELQDLQNAYKKLFGDRTENGGDFEKLKEAAKTDPDLLMVIAQVDGFEKDLNGDTKVDPDRWKRVNGIPNDGKIPDSFNFGKDLIFWGGNINPDPDPKNPSQQPAFIQDVLYLAAEHYDANHTTPTPNPKAVAGGSDVTDHLKTWWGDGDSSQSVTSGQSQQDTTRVQSLMQLLQGFDNTGQQILQSAGAQKTQMVTNQKTQ